MGGRGKKDGGSPNYVLSYKYRSLLVGKEEESPHADHKNRFGGKGKLKTNASKITLTVEFLSTQRKTAARGLEKKQKKGGEGRRVEKNSS